MSHTIRITITDHLTQNTVTRTAYSERGDWMWMLIEFANAVNGAGFVVDPYKLVYDGFDSAFLSVEDISTLRFGGTD